MNTLVLTINANFLLFQVHDRMPAIMMADPGNLVSGNNRQYTDHPGQADQDITAKMRRLQDMENLRNMLIAWNANRLDLFELSMPNEVGNFY